MTPWTLVPAKPFDLAKSRLSPVLNPAERAALAQALLARTLAVARAALGSAPLLVVSPTRDVAAVARAAGADGVVVSDRRGLNAQLADAAARSVPATDALLVLFSDLPYLAAADVAALAASPAMVTLAPDRHRRGTNALLYRGGTRTFRFGADSLARHGAAAMRTEASFAEVERPGLARDLDAPDDWAALRDGSPADARSTRAVIDRLTPVRQPPPGGY